jgi:hypothetical protein
VGGGLGGGVGGGIGAAGHIGGADVGAAGSFGDASRINSQGSVNASDTARAHANAHSAVFDQPTNVTTGALAGLSTGMTVKDSSGTTVGRVSKILRSDDGTVRNVLVASASDPKHTIRLAPASLSIAGGVVTTTTATTH